MNNVKFSPDGKTIVSCSYDKSIKLWDIEKKKQIKQFIGHSEIVRYFHFFQKRAKSKNIIKININVG